MKMQNILDLFNSAIEEKGLKQKSIANQIGTTEDRLSRILAGKSKMLVLEFLQLCYVLQIDPKGIQVA